MVSVLELVRNALICLMASHLSESFCKNKRFGMHILASLSRFYLVLNRFRWNSTDFNRLVVKWIILTYQLLKITLFQHDKPQRPRLHFCGFWDYNVANQWLATQDAIRTFTTHNKRHYLFSREIALDHDSMILMMKRKKSP